MAGRESSRVNPRYKKKYRVSNWAEYERGLRNRGEFGRPDHAHFLPDRPASVRRIRSAR